MKGLITSIFVASFFMVASAMAQKPTPEQTKAVISEFSKLLDREVALGDADALAVKKRAKANNGRVEISYPNMVKLIAKWKKTSYAVRFSKLYEASKLEGDADALMFAKKAKANNGQLRVSAAEMIKFVKKWEAIAAKSEL